MKKIIYNIILVLSIIGLCVALYNIYNHYKDDKNTNKQISMINEKVDINDIEDNDNTEIVEIEDIPESDPYWDYIKMSLIDVNFDELKSINKDVQGWIQVSGTNINYPYVKTNNNDYYLSHSFDKSRNNAGWVFMDYRNSTSILDNKNTIIYAHGRLDETMFGSLKNILTSGWLNNSNNYIIKLSTDYENTLWQVFSVYKIPTTNDYIQTNFSNDEFVNFGNMLIERSSYNFNTSINENDNILTLSTCYNNNEKVALHAKLIKYEKKITE